MKVIQFPNMIANGNRAVVIDGHAAIAQSLRLLLASHVGEFTVDPYWGNGVRNILFDANDEVADILLIDAVYMAIQKYAQFIRLQRRDITTERLERGKVRVNIMGTSLIDYTPDMYSIDLVSMGGEQ